ncbi:MAG: hypothetical protein Ct9H300mP19_13410 [Dehalococcoidia bacterium]|nr:MAG: hypothetical protein Ct9H300mP19_13410 [Dehalococcoidia bacterium]
MAFWAQLQNGPMRVNLGHSNRNVTLELAPEAVSDRSEFTVIDADVQPGFNPYWVKGLSTGYGDGMETARYLLISWGLLKRWGFLGKI